MYPNIQYHVQPLSLDAFGEPLHSFPAFTASVCNLNPTSRGTVQIKNADFTHRARHCAQLPEHPEDRKVAADSLRVTRRIVAQPALAKYQPEEWKPGAVPDGRRPGAAGGRHRHHHLPPRGHHQDGATRDPMAVLDSQMRVRGIHGLRVVDAGPCPPSPAATPTRPR